MNRPETAQLLTVIAAYDRRTLGDTDVYAWQQALDDVPYPDAHQAVIDHYRDTKDWIMPSDVRHGATRIAWRRRGQARRAQLDHELQADGVTAIEAQPPAGPTKAWAALGKELARRTGNLQVKSPSP